MEEEVRTRPAGRVNKCGHIHDNARYAEDGTDEITSPSDSEKRKLESGHEHQENTR